MEDWKQKVEVFTREKGEKQKHAYQQELEKHQARFSCRVCGKTSSGPVSDDGYTDWNKPTGLDICHTCTRYICGEHVHQGVCKICAEDWLAGKSYHERRAIKGWFGIVLSLLPGILSLITGSVLGAVVFLFFGGCAAIIIYLDYVA